ncbi:hypothetical protein, partial [Acinetobacter baumannii]
MVIGHNFIGGSRSAQGTTLLKSKSGLPDLLAHKLIGLLGMEAGKSR